MRPDAEWLVPSSAPRGRTQTALSAPRSPPTPYEVSPPDAAADADAQTPARQRIGDGSTRHGQVRVRPLQALHGAASAPPRERGHHALDDARRPEHPPPR